MKITKIRVTDLFGFFQHEIVLNDSGITFIHGPNGCGKTTMLNLLYYTIKLDLVELMKISFRSITPCIIKPKKGVEYEKAQLQP